MECTRSSAFKIMKRRLPGSNLKPSPAAISLAYGLSCLRFVPTLTFCPPHHQSAAVAPGPRQIVREHKQSKRNHPEAENGQETEAATNNQSAADRDSARLRIRQMKGTAQKMDLVPRQWIETAGFVSHSSLVATRRFPSGEQRHHLYKRSSTRI